MNKKHFLFVYKFLRILGDLIASDKSSSPTFRIDPHLFYGLIFLFADLLCGQGRHRLDGNHLPFYCFYPNS